MSLDVYLLSPRAEVKERSGIFIRENGQTKEITREEWDERNPGVDPVVSNEKNDNEVFHANITHNLGKMASMAGLYYVLWRPEEIGIKYAYDLETFLKRGLTKLKSNPDKYKKYNPENGWGDYNLLVDFTEKYLDACRKYPEAEVKVSR